jgi:hypothetical protein
MEVHRHSHSGNSHQTRKITHYLWEFLMLFLAVFCGSMAEYALHHKIENDREKIYMKNMVEDLKYDTTILSQYLARSDEFERTVDTLYTLFGTADRDQQINRIYFLARMATLRGEPAMVYLDKRTYNQMNYSGLLRLIHNQDVSAKVSSYYLSVERFEKQNDEIRSRITVYMHSAGELFDASVFFTIRKGYGMPASGNLKLLTEDPIIINKFLTAAQYLYGTRETQKVDAKLVLQEARELLLLIQDEYHLKH